MADPLHQFIIQDIVPLEVSGIDLSFTNTSLWMSLAAGLSIAFFALAMRAPALVPGRLQAMAEGLYAFVADMVKENTGTKGMQYFPFIFTLFMVLLMGNMLGLVPYAFTYTSHIAVTGALAVLVFLVVTIVGFARHGLHFFHLFLPEGVPFVLRFFIVPLEMVSYLTRPITLAMRLFANMMAGHLVLKVFAGFCVSLMSLNVVLSFAPMAFNVIMIAFEFLIAALQAYVFTVLTCIYFKDSIYMH